MAAPELKPNMSAKTISAALLVPGIQRPSMKMTVSVQKTIMTLNRPSLSPMMPGIVRPKMEPALRIDTRYSASCRDIPRACATMVMNVMTQNIPQ